MNRLGNPYALFLDTLGNPMTGGKIYIGVPSEDPEMDPITVYWDTALTQIAQQPIRTINGVIVDDSASPAFVYVNQSYSMKVTDTNGVATIPYVPQLPLTDTTAYQPLNANLTAISGQSQQTFGLALLTMANQAAAQSYLGIAPFTGGTVTSNIVRQGAGVVPYFADSGITGGRIFITAVGAADPTSLPGDVWYQV